MANLKTKVNIGGVTILDTTAGTPKLALNWEYERTTQSGISELKLIVLKATNDTINLQVGQRLEIWKGFSTATDEKIFDGYVSDFEPDGGIISITGKDKMWDLVRKNVNKVYFDTGSQAGQISAIAEDLIETYGGLTAEVVATGTLAGEKIEQFKCIHVDIYSRLMALAKAVDYQVYYNPVTNKVYFEPRGNTDSGKTLTTGTEIIGVPKWSYDTSQLVNDLRVDGAVVETQKQETGRIGTTSGYTTASILLTKTPEIVELLIDSSNPPTTQRLGGAKDGSTGNYYYVDKETKKIFPITGTAYTNNDYAIVNYSWLAPAPIHMENAESQTTYGVFEKEITLSDIITIADAEARAVEILNKFSVPFETGEILLKSATDLNLNVGERVTIVDNINNPTVNKELVILKQTIKYPGSFQELVVGDNPLRLSDWQVNIEERIKRIEERDSQNQDLVMELFNNAYTFKTEPRYWTVQTKQITGNTLVYNHASSGLYNFAQYAGVGMIWGSATLGIWGTNKWGDPFRGFILSHPGAALLGTSELGEEEIAQLNHFVQQYQNIYTENFIDDDFKDTGGSSTWAATGSTTFTNRQDARSLAIDYNNATVTSAKLTSTVASGAFTYYLTANGGANWETVTSGTTHTFTNTGTDLRWKATESAGLTGEISKIIVEGYH